MNGHGGMRVGSGAKPQKPRFASIDGNASPLAVAPDHLPEDHKPFWNRWAKLAIEAETLNERTACGFEELCGLEAEKRAMRATIDADGRTYIKVTVDGTGTEHTELKAHPLVAKHLALCKQVDSMMARFKLTAFGKPEVGGKKRPQATNAWASVAGA